MKTSIQEVEARISNMSEWTITTICPSKGAIIVINNAFTKQITTYRKDDVSGKYNIDKEMAYNEVAKAPLTAMIAAHNASEANQKEAEQFNNI